MDAVFRPRKSYLYQSAGGLAAFLLWAAAGMSIAYFDPGVKHRLLAMALIAGIPMTMAILSAFLLAIAWTEELQFSGDRLIHRFLNRQREFLLSESTRAQWRTTRTSGKLILRSGSEKLSIDFDTYEPDARESIIRQVREKLAPEAQEGWDYFEQRQSKLERRRTGTKPGPGEILISRRRYDRMLMPALVVTSILGAILWRLTGKSALFVVPQLAVLAGWALLRFATPTQGLVTPKITLAKDPAVVRYPPYFVPWSAAVLVGLFICLAFHRRLSYPVATFIALASLFYGPFIYETIRLQKRRSQYSREAAEKSRAEAVADPWPLD
ncbi:hypothetical protein [Singulisphaera sp. PoT]|uniref:hypothetical protein n=1 Tax=Singulisphaera sp. PoT TaxID=3411797 RepID=UPI003BF4F513